VLLDEPLTAAQPEFKWQLRQTLKSLQREMGATMIYVTHDQTEALTFADRVSVLHEGRILQTAEPATLLAQPAHQHVGYFVGSPGMNLLDGEIREGRCRVNGVDLGAVSGSAGSCQIGFRPEWAHLTPTEPSGAGLPVTIRATRTLTTRRARPVGLAVAEFEGHEIVTRQPLDGIDPGRGWLIVDDDRLICFRDGWRLPADA
jgi:glycerol transport system ATP-binding protein